MNVKFPALEAAQTKLTALENELRNLKAADPDLKAAGLGERAINIVRGIDKRRGEIEALKGVLTSMQGPGHEHGDGAAPVDTRLGETKSAAQYTLEAAFKSAGATEDAAAKAEALLSQGTIAEQTLAARWVKAAGDQDYLTAFFKLAKDPARGHMLWTDRERAAYTEAKSLQGVLKAGSLTGNSEMLPLFLDPTINLTSNGSTNPLRAISRVVQTTSNTWQGVTSAGVSAEWKTEGAQMTDATPGTDPASIPVHFGDAWVPYSFELEGDAAPAWTRELAALLVDAANQLQNTAYTLGTGTGQPTGIITALPAGSVVNTATADIFAKADVYSLQQALPPRFQPNARWACNLSILNSMSQMETTAGARLFPELSEGRLLNRPIHEVSDMDGVINATQTNKILLYGDFSNFVIVDRIGTTVEFVPHVVGVDGRPTGQRGMIMWFRTGSDVVVDNAFRVLDA